MKKLLTQKQAAVVQTITKHCEETGLPPTVGDIVDAHAQIYAAKDRDSASALARKNLRKPEFRAALALDSEETKSKVGVLIQKGLDGALELWPGDKELFALCLKLAHRSNFAEKAEVVTKTDTTAANDPRVADASDADWHYYIDHRHWPWEEDAATLNFCEVCHPEYEVRRRLQHGENVPGWHLYHGEACRDGWHWKNGKMVPDSPAANQ